MSFPRYSEYKDSGVEWLGEVPVKWGILRLGRVTLGKCDGPFGSGLKSEHYSEQGIRVVRLQNIRSGHFDGADAAFIQPNYYHQALGGGHDVAGGDLLIAGLGDERNVVGRACVAPDDISPAMVKADCFRFRVDLTRVDAGFLAAQLNSGAEYDAGQWSSGSTRSRISLSAMAARVILLPSLREQSAIAAFLDRETGKIDALVAEQEKLIELLKEKRQAVISHAVTKGLDPSVPMKDSGISWLGEVPAHWEVVKFRRCVYVAEGQVNPEEEPYVQMILLAPNYVESGTGRLLGTETAGEQGAESGKYICERGDVVYSKIRPALRKVCVAPESCLCSADMYPLRAHSGMTNGFLLWFILSEQFSAWAIIESDRVAMPKINRGSLADLTLLAPPLAEQQEIVERLNAEVARIDALMTESQRAIDLLKERRSALISAAVTGKIDLRGLVGEEAA